MPTRSVKNDDIVLFHDGEMARVIEVDWPVEGMTRMEFLSEDESRCVNTKSMNNTFEVLEDSVSNKALYYSMRSLHLRLNKLGNI